MGQNYTKSKGSRRGEKLYQPDPKRFLYNVDTLWYTYDAENFEAVMGDILSSNQDQHNKLSEKLEKGKIKASNSKLKDYIQVKLKRYENPIIFEIQTFGQAPVYAYQIRNEDMAFYFANRRRGDDTFPIKVQINQLKLWELGVQEAYKESLSVLSELGFVFTSSKPSRIDLCVHSDQWIWNFSDLQDFEYPRNFSQDNHPDFVKLDMKTGHFETVYFGDRSRLQLRIYNKSKEIQSKRKYYFLELYKQRGMDVNKVWNHEFEIHRSYLRDFANECTGEVRVFDSMDFLLYENGLSMLWKHLVSHFVHHSAFWSVLQKGDINNFVDCKNYLFRLKDINVNKMAEVAQIGGRLQKLVLDKDLPNNVDMMKEAMNIFASMYREYQNVKEINFEDEVYRKRQRYMDIELSKLSLQHKQGNDKDNMKKSASQNDTDTRF